MSTLDAMMKSASNGKFSTFQEAQNYANSFPISTIGGAVTTALGAIAAGVVHSLEDTAINNIYVKSAIGVVTVIALLAQYVVGKKQISAAEALMQQAKAKFQSNDQQPFDDNTIERFGLRPYLHQGVSTSTKGKTTSSIAQQSASSSNSIASNPSTVVAPKPSTNLTSEETADTLIYDDGATKTWKINTNNYYAQIQAISAAQRQKASSIQSPQPSSIIPDVDQAPILFSGKDVNKVLQGFYKTALEPFFNGLVALKKNLMQPKEGEEKQINELLENLLKGLHNDSEKPTTDKSVQKILQNLILLLEDARFDTDKVAKETFWTQHKTGEQEELSTFKKAQFLARANSERTLGMASPVKTLELDANTEFTISQAQAVFDQLSHSLEPIFFAFFKIISSMEAREGKEPQIRVRLGEMQKVWTEQETKLASAEKETIERVFGTYIQHLNRFMGSVSMNLGEEQTQEQLVAIYFQGSKANTNISGQQQYFETKPLEEEKSTPSAKDFIPTEGGIGSKAKVFGGSMKKSPSTSDAQH